MLHSHENSTPIRIFCDFALESVECRRVKWDVARAVINKIESGLRIEPICISCIHLTVEEPNIDTDCSEVIKGPTSVIPSVVFESFDLCVVYGRE